MNEQDAAVIKVLTELGLRDDPKVQPKFENLYPKDDPEEQFYGDVIKLFNENKSLTLSGDMPEHIEMVSVDVLDRWAEDLSWANVPELDMGDQAFASEDLTKHPIRMSYDRRTGKALIRDPIYASMREAGFSRVPVMVIQQNLQGRGVKVPTPVRNNPWLTVSDLGIE